MSTSTCIFLNLQANNIVSDFTKGQPYDTRHETPQSLKEKPLKETSSALDPYSESADRDDDVVDDHGEIGQYSDQYHHPN